MAKLSQQDWKRHEQACELVECDRKLTEQERDFVVENWNPMAVHNVGAAGAFFTPADLACELMGATLPRRRVVDLCAGIGMLSWTAFKYARYEEIDITCIEYNPEFIKVGKRVLPEATWIQGNIFDKELIKSLGRFSYVLSNPPFGKPKSLRETDTTWLATCGQGAEVMALEVALYLADDGAFILPAPSSREGTNVSKLPAKGDTAVYTYFDYCEKRTEWQLDTGHGRHFRPKYPDYRLLPLCVDTSDVQWNGAKPCVELGHYSIAG